MKGNNSLFVCAVKTAITVNLLSQPGTLSLAHLQVDIKVADHKKDRLSCDIPALVSQEPQFRF